MSYNANQHATVVQRIENAMRAVNDVIAREMAELDDIYIEETASGADPAWTDHGDYTEGELVNAIVAFRAFETTRTAPDRCSRCGFRRSGRSAAR